MTNYYLHTINGYPAGFTGEQICYAQKFKGWSAPLCKSLKQIKKEQKLTFAFRSKNGFSLNISEYNYVIVKVKEARVTK